MNKSFHLTNFRQLNIFIIYDGSCAFLIVCRICFAYLNLGNPLFFLRDLLKALRKAACRFILHVCKSKTVCLPKIWIFILILGRRNSRKLTCAPVAFNLIGKHEIIDLTAAAKGLCKHNRLFGCRICSVLNCFVCHLSYPEIECIA